MIRIALELRQDVVAVVHLTFLVRTRVVLQQSSIDSMVSCKIYSSNCIRINITFRRVRERVYCGW
jgi:hypothetical protein